MTHFWQRASSENIRRYALRCVHCCTRSWLPAIEYVLLNFASEIKSNLKHLSTLRLIPRILITRCRYVRHLKTPLPLTIPDRRPRLGACSIGTIKSPLRHQRSHPQPFYVPSCASKLYKTRLPRLSMLNGTTFPLIEPQPMPSALPERRSKILRHFTIAFGQDSWKDAQAGSGASTPLSMTWTRM